MTLVINPGTVLRTISVSLVLTGIVLPGFTHAAVYSSQQQNHAAQNGRSGGSYDLAGEAANAEEWLASAPSDSYTIQLATVNGLENCLATKKKYQVDSMYCIQSSTMPDSYFAVHGVFPSRSVAEQSAADMGLRIIYVNYLASVQASRCEMPNMNPRFSGFCTELTAEGDKAMAMPNIAMQRTVTPAAVVPKPTAGAPKQITSPPKQVAGPPKQVASAPEQVTNMPKQAAGTPPGPSADDWLLSAPANSYTIQLATIYGYEKCLSVQAQYPIDSMYCIPSSSVANRYFAVTGVYPSRSQASQAADDIGADDAYINYLPRVIKTRCEMSDMDPRYRNICDGTEIAQVDSPAAGSRMSEAVDTASIANKPTPMADETGQQSGAPAEDTWQAKKTEPSPLHDSVECTAEAIAAAKQRRRPNYPVLVYEPDPCNQNRLAPPKAMLLPDPAPVPDRWRIVDALGYEENLWDPYSNNNPLKGDKPVFGKEWFINLSAISDTVYEPRQFPLPVGAATTTDAGQLDLLTNSDQYLLNENLIVETVLYKGDTVFRPPDHEFRLITVFNVNHTVVDERGLLKADPARGTERTEGFIGIQGAFWDYHIRNVSDRYDFDSFRIGIQPFSSDFRGFLFQDNQFGVRFFGIRDNNIFQYNLAWFRRLEKESNSGLNDITESLRDDDIFFANLYWQDFPRLGFNSQASLTYNRNREADDFYFDHNQFIARPSSLGFERGRDYDIGYLGLSGDGHFGRNNLTYSAYYAFGDQSNGVFTNDKTDVSAYFLAAELSRDYDWIRAKASFLHSSGDDDPFDNKERGFDAIFENPQFAGGDTAFFIRQNVPLIGGGRVALNGRNSIIPSLRSSKEHGQSNFTNPGITLIGLGTDLDLTPQTRLSFNFNQMWFDDTSVLELARNQTNISKNIGQDLSAALIWRPLATQNIVFRLSGAVLLPGSGFEDLYGDGTPFSVLGNLILTY
ncbi:MAG: hypothetical protein KJP04_08225 [Arenicella sp.]|nr:hypothetical protein [Arenicella sp.]